jgi:hypothetical protein
MTNNIVPKVGDWIVFQDTYYFSAKFRYHMAHVTKVTAKLAKVENHTGYGTQVRLEDPIIAAFRDRSSAERMLAEITKIRQQYEADVAFAASQGEKALEALASQVANT